MKLHSIRIASLALLVALMAGMAGQMQAQETGSTALKEHRPERSRPFGMPQLPAGARGGPQAQAFAQGKVKLVVELAGEPTAVVYSRQLGSANTAQATSAAKAQLASIEQAQQQVLRQLHSLNASVIYRTQRVLNAIAVQVDAKDVLRIQHIPGVKSVRPLTAKQRDLTTSVPLIGAPALWEPSTYGLTGENITIGIIDTGIDYTHASFGGAGTVAAYTSNDPTVISDAGFPSAKVIGGYDFAGDAYDANDPDSLPDPDPDPLDCNGHGSHVASTAAGYGVTTAGQTYTGPYSAALDMDMFRIGPGVAPRARLYALKVFGCEGSTDVTDSAIEWAVDPDGDGDFSDHLDVINMSLGSDFGGGEDSSVIASDNAVLAGVIVVTSAGNSGDTNYIAGSPGVANRVISTASSVDSSSVVDAFRVSGATANPALNKLHPGSNSVRYPWTNPTVTVPPTMTLPLTATLYYPPVAEATGCAPFSAATRAAMAGKIVLLDWYEPSCAGSIGRAANVRLGGGVGVLMIDYEANNPDAFDLSINGDFVLPAQSIPKGVGDALKAELAVNPNAKAAFSRAYNQAFTFLEEEFVDTMSAFSSRGPSGIGLKPDVTAPGQSIFAAGVGTGNQGANLSGTSMASPHVAGSMALLRQLHPAWSVEELKALVMNTATKDIRTLAAPTSILYSPTRQGAGRVVLPQAADEDVIAYSQDSGWVSVSFGNLEVLGSVTLSKSFIVENKGSSARTFTLSYDGRSTIPGVSYTLSSSSVSVAPGDSELVSVVLQATAADMLHTVDPALNLDQNLAGQTSRFWQSEAAGYINFVEAGGRRGLGPTLRLPLYATARPAALMQAVDTTIDLGDVLTASLGIELNGIEVLNQLDGSDDETDPEDIVSVVHALELQTISPNETSSAGASDAADLQFIGIMSDVSATGVVTDDTLISIGLATQADWVTPQAGYDVEFDVYFDTDKDGEEDYVMFNYNVGQALGGTDATDDFVTLIIDLNTGVASFGDYLNYLPPAFLDTYPFNTNVLVMPVYASSLGLTAADADFNYYVASFHRYYDDGAVDVSPIMAYNAASPGIDTTGGAAGSPWWLDLDGETIPVEYNRAAASGSKALGVLLLHHNNIRGRRVEIVNFDFDRLAYMTYLPLIKR